MIPQHVLIGGLLTILCLMGLVKETWVLRNSAYGKCLVRWFGPRQAPAAYRVLLGITVIFGVLLAAGIIRPVKW